jgi:hypothetical protein
LRCDGREADCSQKAGSSLLDLGLVTVAALSRTIHEPSRNRRQQGQKYLAGGSVEGDTGGQPTRRSWPLYAPLTPAATGALASLTTRLSWAESKNACSSQRDAGGKGELLGVREPWRAPDQEPHSHAHPHRHPARKTYLLGRAGMTGFVRPSVPKADYRAPSRAANDRVRKRRLQ